MGNYPFSPETALALGVGSIWTATLSTPGGEYAFPRSVTGDNVGTFASGIMPLTYFIAQRTEAITRIFTEVSGTAASGLTTAAIGIYSVDASGNLTLAASISDPTLWIASYTLYTRTMASWAKTAGQLYAIGFLQIGTTPATLSGLSVSYGFAAGSLNVAGLGQPLFGEVTGLSSLPASVPAGSIAQNYYGFNAALLT
jgi:hypothetical protein